MDERYEVGDRFETRDSRDEGRVVEIIEARDGQDDYRDSLGYRYVVQTEVHPRNPSAVGRKSTISSSTLNRRYTKISR